MKEFHVDKNSLRIVQINLILWSVIIMTSLIYAYFENLLQPVQVNGVELSRVHLSMLISFGIAVPLGFVVNRFWKKYLAKVVKVNP